MRLECVALEVCTYKNSDTRFYYGCSSCPVVSQCFDGEFRVDNITASMGPDGSGTLSGRVEVCYNSTYGSVCDYGWDETDARILCNNFVRNTLGISPDTLGEC